MDSAADIRTAPTRPNLRAYLAGGGATAALVAGAVVVFLAVAAFVAFSGLPFGADDAADGTVEVTAAAPAAAAAAAAAATDAVAASPATPSAAALAEIAAAAPPGGVVDGAPGAGTADTGTTGTGPAATPPPTVANQPGIVGGSIQDVEGAAGDLGVEAPLGEITKAVTEPVDETLSNTLNGVGGLLGEPKLGDGVGGTLDGLTDG